MAAHKGIFGAGRYMRSAVLAAREKDILAAPLRPLCRLALSCARHPVRSLRRGHLKFVLGLTASCPCHCTHCGVRGPSTAREEELDTGEVLRLLGEMSAMPSLASTVSFFGGEPLLRKDIYELVRRARRLGMVCEAETSGVPLGAQQAGMLKASGLHHIYVSVDSADPVRHDDIRGLAGCHEKAVQGIRHCLAIGLSCSISTCVFPQGVRSGEVQRMHSLARELGVVSLRFLFPRPSGALQGDRGGLLSAKEMAEVHSQMEPGFSYVESVFSGCSGDTRGECSARSGHLVYISPHGEVGKCPFTRARYGNIRQQALGTLVMGMHSGKGGQGSGELCGG